MTAVSLLAPEMCLTAAGLFLLVGEKSLREKPRLALGFAAAAAVLAAVLVFRADGAVGAAAVFGSAVVDGLSQFLKILLLGGLLLVLGLSAGEKNLRGQSGENAGAVYSALLLFSAVGTLLMVSATEFLTALVGLEIVSISSFVLTGFLRGDRRSGEAAIKYFLVGAFSTGLMIYGISLLYGIAGSVSFSALLNAAVKIFPHAFGAVAVPAAPSFVGPSLQPVFITSLLFILVGLGFKLALAPFHMWAPDAYEGAPTPITAYLSTAPKAAALGILLRAVPFHEMLGLSTVLAVLAAFTMTLGNITALRQTSVKRMMAYSSIAQIGYVLTGFVAAGPSGLSSVLVYISAYFLMNLGLFACLIVVTNDTGTDDINGFSGLSERSLPMALIATVFLLSLTGIPPMVGFIGKFSVFAAALSKGWIWLSVVGVLNSVLSLYYYFDIVRRMFFLPPSRTEPISFSFPLTACLWITLAGTLLIGVFPNPLLTAAARLFP